MGQVPLKRKIDVIRTGMPKYRDFYYRFMRASWGTFFLGATLFYMGMNALFALLYFLGGDAILNARPDSYWDAFMFSFQTSTTIGYGHMLPKTGYANFLVILDSMCGLLFVAIVTGLAFSKFSRPTARIIFSKPLLVARFNGVPTLQFRVANGRNSLITNATVSVVTLVNEVTQEGVKMRRMKELKLDRQATPLFTLTWTIIHPIDEDSPFYGVDFSQSLKLLLVISFCGIEEGYSQTVTAQHFYNESNLVAGKHFTDILHFDKDGLSKIDFTRFHQVE